MNDGPERLRGGRCSLVSLLLRFSLSFAPLNVVHIIPYSYHLVERRRGQMKNIANESRIIELDAI